MNFQLLYPQPPSHTPPSLLERRWRVLGLSDVPMLADSIDEIMLRQQSLSQFPNGISWLFPLSLCVSAVQTFFLSGLISTLINSSEPSLNIHSFAWVLNLYIPKALS